MTGPPNLPPNLPPAIPPAFPAAAAAGAAAGGAWLSAEQVQQIEAARVRGRKIRRAAVVAAIDGWTVGIFAALTLLGGLIELAIGGGFDVGGLILGLGMAVVSYFGFRGSNGLKRLDERAPRALALNQLALGVMLAGYAALRWWAAAHDPAPLGEVTTDPEALRLLRPYEDATRTLKVLVYAAVLLAGVVGCGLTALYYHSRARHIREYLQRTPGWLLDLQRAGMSL